MQRIVLGLSLVWSCFGCSDTSPVRLGECGNHVLESGEDCDGDTGCSATCRFSCSAARSCPTGWGCDIGEGVCRAASGHFHETSLQNDSSGMLEVADFDGDGRDDLLLVPFFQGVASTVSFFSPQGEPERTVRLPPASAAAVADVTGDTRPDVFLGGSAVSAFRSEKSRSFSPLIGALVRTGPSATLLAIDIDCDGLRDFLVFEGNRLSRVSADGTLASTATLPITAELLNDRESGTLGALRAVGKLDALGTFCELVALPGVEPGKVDIYGPKAVGAEILEHLSTVSYDRDLSPSRWLLADINSDGHDDLFITSSDSNAVSYGLGDGTFHSDPSAVSTLSAGGADGQARPIQPPVEVLAAVGMPQGEPVLFPVGGFAGDSIYESARAVDLTGDGLLDIAAVGFDRTVDVWRGQTSGRFSLLSLPTHEGPRLQDAGDLDGDGVDDLLLIEAPGDDQLPKAISVLFSRVDADSPGPIKLAEFAGIEQLVAGHLTRAGSTTAPLSSAVNGANADVAVLYAGEQGGKKLGFLAGGSDKLLRPILAAAAARQGERSGARTPVLGRFVEPNTRALVLIEDVTSIDPATGDTRVDTSRVTLFKVDQSGTTPVESATPGVTLRADAGTAAFDGDGDGIDELYALTLDSLVTLRKRGSGFDAVTILTESGLERLWLQDADGDGRSDLLVARGVDLWVLTAASDSSVSKLHHFSSAALGCQDFVSYAFLQADTDPELELAISCAPATQQDDTATADDVLMLNNVDFSRDGLVLASRAPGPAGGNFVVGDFNGDGVQDIAGGTFAPSISWGEARP